MINQIQKNDVSSRRDNLALANFTILMSSYHGYVKWPTCVNCVISCEFGVIARRLLKVGSMLAHRLRRWTNNEHTLGGCNTWKMPYLLLGRLSQQTRGIDPILF